MTSPTVNSAPYGSWRSPLTIQAFIEYAPLGLGQLKAVNGTLYWLEARPAENGRQVIVRFANESETTITPAGYSIRTRVHEYGGNAFTLADHKLWFVNDEDQDIYEQDLKNLEAIRRVTETGISERYADPVYIDSSHKLLCIRERHGIASEAVNDVVTIDLTTGSSDVLHEGHDFYGHARISPNQSRIAFLAWDHPNMPWDGTQLYIQELGNDSNVAQIVAGGHDESIFQPEWLNDETLLYCSDKSGFYDICQFSSDGTRVIAENQVDYGHAMWQLGSSQFLVLDEHRVLATTSISDLKLIDTTIGLQTPVEEVTGNFSNLTKLDPGFAFICSSKTSAAEVRFKQPFTSPSRRIKRSGNFPMGEEYISVGAETTYEGSNGEPVHAYYYRPCNPEFRAASDERPPLLVLAHGGPTASTSSSLSASIQFFTSRGWSVLDVNYSGKYWIRP